MKVFCTGASGYIGGSVAAHLVAAGHQVIGLVRSQEKADSVRAKGIQPLFPFGYGLSYTSYRYSGLRVTPVASGTQDVQVTATVTNTGHRSGTDVAQLYVTEPASAGEPPRQLKGFQRVGLAPGQSQRVRFTLKPSDLQWFDPSATPCGGRRSPEP